ncbi:MAG: hypothetical protein LW817_04655 [Candidatus Caenarcaniphilales bacterium]|jgi:predicted O-linked N-acetylglucosamine transferase (SPINDLY family)|nr:hypothetical protein [Candidatus Caenarcaniphilales bacterium]
MTLVKNKDIQKSLKLINEFKYDDAIYLLKKVLRNDVNNPQALSVLGQLYISKTKFKEAISIFEKLLKFTTNDYSINNNLALAFELSEDHDKAIGLYQKMLDQKIGSSASNLHGLGRVFARQGADYNALPLLIKASEYLANDHLLHNNIAYCASRLGLYNIALKHFRIAKFLAPDQPQYLRAEIFHSFQDPEIKLSEIHSLAKEYYKKFIATKIDHCNFNVDSRLEISKKTFRLGFVSADFYLHPVTSNLLPILELIDKNTFEIYIYDNGSKQDDVNQRLKSLVNSYRIISTKSDLEVASIIYQDQIDILFDLSGFTGGTRLGVFKSRPAPVQVHHLGFFGTLAMPEIDFIIADSNLVKDGEEKYFTEKIYKMPHTYVHCDLSNLPEPITQCPFETNGFITFGSFNNFQKISPRMFELWAELLTKVADSKLLFDSKILTHDSNKKYVYETFEKYGINRERVIIKSSQTRENFLESYNQVDISLDVYPYGAGTTAIESLMKNVPIVTIEGDRWTSRQAALSLKAIEMDDLIANSFESYISIIQKLALDSSRLRVLRRSLRAKLSNSPMSLKTYVSSFEFALNDMWRIKCLEKLQNSP